VGCIVNSNRIIVNTTAVVNSGVAFTNGIHWSSNEIHSMDDLNFNSSNGTASILPNFGKADEVRAIRAF